MNQMVSFCDRLREERQRLGMSQTVFAERGSVTKKTQALYENGGRYPDARYLAAVAAIGVDVLYVLTGGRSSAQLTAAELPPRNRRVEALLDNYEHSDDDGRRTIERTALLAARVKAGDAQTEEEAFSRAGCERNAGGF